MFKKRQDLLKYKTVNKCFFREATVKKLSTTKKYPKKLLKNQHKKQLKHHKTIQATAIKSLNKI